MTDYVAETEIIRDSLHRWMEQDGQTDPMAVALAIDAHTAATLALAENARVANLIAYRSVLENRPPYLPSAHADDGAHEYQKYARKVELLDGLIEKEMGL